MSVADEILSRFQQKALADLSSGPDAFGGFVIFYFVEGSVSTTMKLLYTDGKPRFTRTKLSDDTSTLAGNYLDALSDGDVDESAMVATYAVGTKTWNVRTYFGQDARHWFINPGNVMARAEEVRPL